MKSFNEIKKTTIAVALTLPLMAVSGSAFATGGNIERDTQPQYIGVGSGAALGALVGGPVGAFAGALVGGLIGEVSSYKNYSIDQEEELASMNQLLSENHQQIALMNRKYSESQLAIADLRASQRENRFDLDLQMDIQFRTNSADIEPHFRAQLDELAGIMRQDENMLWDLEGHADVRGQKNYNQQLSEKRVRAVFDYLVAQGVSPAQLTTQAYGAELPLESNGDREGYFFDRRVSLRAINGNTETASK
ncbi:hypothetical protein CS022_03385 [Veronia nyctiphanis]|uniref:OmpA-like domain-containing protein n=1 Tax=Veronia nyctiphanis TaxID=1278244 RepID=A0A4Q0YV04_9GAMM|nr:sortase-associated OmpA-like protein PdsO [Veronia nyctiphanis]RXJ74673.1 hypothetical protein CS022_03385 [Veronia nyctiphanis]